MKSGLLSSSSFALPLLGVAFAPALALAMGGGGQMQMTPGAPLGGQTPSLSGPRYDPVEEYRHGAAALKAGKYRTAAQDFERITEVQPKIAAVWYLLGLARSGDGDVKGAAHAYEKAVKLDPQPIEPHREFAVALAKLRQNDRASAELEVLKTRAAACNETCPQAAALKAAIAAVEASLSSSDVAAGEQPLGSSSGVNQFSSSRDR